MTFEQVETEQYSRTFSNVWHGLHGVPWNFETEYGVIIDSYCDMDSLMTCLYFWGTDGVLFTPLWVLNILKHIYIAKTLIIYCKNI